MKCLALASLVIALVGVLFVRANRVARAAPPAAQTFTVSSIGHVTKEAGKTHLVLNPRYEGGLLGLDGFSHILVYWWCHRNDTSEKRAILRVHPRGNQANPLTGVFATRSPCRPNPIAMTLCKLISVKRNVVEIEWIDAFAGTPVLDIKPYVPRSDSISGATVPEWLKTRQEKP